MAELPSQRDFDDFSAWSGRDVVDAEGERLGAIDLIFLDEATGTPGMGAGQARRPRGVRAAGGRDGRRPLDPRPAAVRAALPAAPEVEIGETLSVADEERLYEHYGLEYSSAESATVLPKAPARERPRLKKYVGAPVAAPAAEEPRPTPRRGGGRAAATTAADERAAAPPSRRRAAADMAPRNLSDATPSDLPPSAAGAPAAGRLPGAAGARGAGSQRCASPPRRRSPARSPA